MDKRQVLTSDISANKSAHSPTRTQLHTSLFLLGFITIISQTTLLREFLAIFNGNELIIGVFLFNWMIITAIGALTGEKTSRLKLNHRKLFLAFLALTILPIVQVIVLNTLKNVLFIQGMMVAALHIFMLSFVILIPFCIPSGYLFSMLSTYLSDSTSKNQIPRAYAIETLGSLVGGLLFSFFFAWFFNSLQTLSITLLICFLALSFILRKDLSIKLIAFTLSVSLIPGSLSFAFDTGKWLRGFLHPNQEILFAKSTPYNDLVVTRQAELVCFYYDSKLAFTTQNNVFNEETVHYPMLQHPDPKRVLIISGGVSGISLEINKYKIDQLDYIEPDRWIFSIGKAYANSLNDSLMKLKTIVGDVNRYMSQYYGLPYDVVIMVQPEPVSAQINRYYTLEFFEKIKSIINSNGVFSLSISSSINYMNESELYINTTIFNTLKTLFNNVVIIPGEKFYFIASDSFLTTDIAKRIEQRGINTTYVNKYYIDDELVKERSTSILNELKSQNKYEINENFKPRLYYAAINNWLQIFARNKAILGAIISFILLIFLIKSRFNMLDISIMISGMTVSTIEFSIILIFQVIFGSLYQALGAIMALFMLGLALGSYCEYKGFIKPKLRSLQIVLGITSIIIIYFILQLAEKSINIIVLQLVMAFSITLLSALSGIIFARVSKCRSQSVQISASHSYGFELVGAAVGMLVASLYFIPVFGILQTVLGIGIINGMFGTLLILTKKTT